jgi:serine/threonine protein kinase
MLGTLLVDNEVRAIGKLCHGGHKHIILRVANFPDHSYAYIDMEICDFNLEAFNKSNWNSIQKTCPILQAPGCLSLDILNIMKQIANGLTYIHSRGEIHRELKPRNSFLPTKVILIKIVLYSISDNLWKLSDFGLTSEGESRIAITTASGKGTPGYRSPELLLEEKQVYNRKVDIWAMGIIFHELATGKKPVVSDTAVGLDYLSGESVKISLNEGFDERSKKANASNVWDMLQRAP